MLSLHTLNPQQRLAVETLDGPVLILAGAGTGKTRVITYRIAHLIARGIPSDNILGVTFTNKAAREMQERVAKLVARPARNRKTGVRGAQGTPGAEASSRPTLCTFHSLCVRILRQHIEKLGYKRNFVIYNESEQLGALRKVLARLSVKGEKVDAPTVLHWLSRLKNAGDEGAFAAGPIECEIAQQIRPRYESALRACNAVDFDDLILLTLRLFEEQPDALEACRTKYRYVMVDEYQDTNAAQFKLVHALTSTHRNLCVVGDDDQSIYGWRGAQISNLLEMEKHFPEVKVIKLEQNYRSTNTILNAANAVIKHNLRRRGKHLWSQKGDGPKVNLYTFKNEEEEARTIVEQINFARLARRTPLAEHAILFRTNAQSRPLETALRQAGVPYHLVGGQSFFDRREVRDFLAYLKTFLNPRDDVSLLRIANVPARGMTDVTMERLLAASHEHKISVFDVMKNPAVVATFQARTAQSIEAFVQLVEQTRDRLLHGTLAGLPRPLQTWAEEFLDRVGYFNDLRRLEKTAEAAEARIRNLKELMATLDGGESGSPPASERLERFLEEISLDSDRNDKDEAHGDSVTLITMHSCKGLEFPNVYVVGMEDGLLPHARSKEEGTLDEERRLFYVAITRAMRGLTISHCATRQKFGKPAVCHPSPFLKDLPPELVEHADQKATRPVPVESAKSMFDVVRAGLD